MKTTAQQDKQLNTPEPTLYMALELAKKQWKLAFSAGMGQKPRLVSIPGGDRQALLREIQRAKRRFRLPEKTPVLSCYEAGPDGFWIHRYLDSIGIDNRVVDSASIEVNRRLRQRKSDSLDARKLVEMLIRHHWGETRVWRILRVPSRQDEDDRHLGRAYQQLQQEKRATGNRIRGLLASEGIEWKGPVVNIEIRDLEKLRNWERAELGAGMRSRLEAQIRLLKRVAEEIGRIESKRKELFCRGRSKKLDQIRQLEKLKGVGMKTSWVLVMEAFGWRQFRNRSQVGGFMGYVPTPYDSGGSKKERGISKAGNVWCRQILMELAWSWMRYQPHSTLTLWFEERFAGGGRVARKIGAVAVARRLAIELWRYLEYDEIPAGAVFYSSLQPLKK